MSYYEICLSNYGFIPIISVRSVLINLKNFVTNRGRWLILLVLCLLLCLLLSWLLLLLLLTILCIRETSSSSLKRKLKYTLFICLWLLLVFFVFRVFYSRSIFSINLLDVSLEDDVMLLWEVWGRRGIISIMTTLNDFSTLILLMLLLLFLYYTSISRYIIDVLILV